MVNDKWMRKCLCEYTLDDAIEAHKNGYCIICADGTIKYIMREDV